MTQKTNVTYAPTSVAQEPASGSLINVWMNFNFLILMQILKKIFSVQKRFAGEGSSRMSKKV